MSPRVYLDTNIFIAAFETAGLQSTAAWQVLDAAEARSVVCVTSELTLAELLSKPPADSQALQIGYRDIIRNGGGLHAAAVSRSILIEAAAIRRLSSSIRLPDAIHLATAAETACSHFMTGDRRLPGPWPFKLVRLDSRSLDEIES